MQSDVPLIVSALKIIKKENPDSEAIGLLEEVLKKYMKSHILEIASMTSVIDTNEVEDELKNGLKLLRITNLNCALLKFIGSNPSMTLLNS